jgi:hypothetical protein
MKFNFRIGMFRRYLADLGNIGENIFMKKREKKEEKNLYICLRKKEVSDVPSDIRGVEG